MTSIILWAVFAVFVLGMLALDFLVLQRDEHEIKVKEAAIWTFFWILLALIFNAGIWYFAGREMALEFITGYLIEKSLSVDNIFVFIIIFSYFGIEAKYQHKVLFWGIIGAVVMRAVFIFAGVALIERFHWIIYVLGAFLVYIGIKMAVQKEKEVHPEKNPVLRAAGRFLRLDREYRGSRFFVRKNGKLYATTMFIVLLVIETTDVVFAVDSIPAILSISTHPFIVLTSNIFAILGLRALYFAVSGVMRLFVYLNYGLAVILVFVGVKMLIADLYKIPVWAALGFVALTLTASILLSVLKAKKQSGS